MLWTFNLNSAILPDPVLKSSEDSSVDDAAVVAVAGLVVGLQALAFFDPGLDDAPQLLGARISINVISRLCLRELSGLF